MTTLLAHKIVEVFSENKGLLGKSTFTMLTASLSTLEVIGDISRDVSAILAVVVGAFTIAKLAKDFFFKEKKA